ncbi:ABC transporter permease [Spongisporangium articulatum]|uniref:ABC transporter permease n=1 Tax=Spongisporangium articulatum TaxID=3362603 RepID=A0ABW8AJC8_9ACTN
MTVAWPAVRAIARRELRRSWLALVVLGLLAGSVGAVATGAMVVERRTATAEARLRAAMGVEDLRVSALNGVVPSTEGIPGIARQWRPSMAVGQIVGPALNYLAVLSGPAHPGIFNPVVVEGRAVNPRSTDEIMVAEEGARQMGMDVGDVVRLHFLTVEQAGDWVTGIGEPRGPTLTFHVVGLTRITPKASNGVGVMASPAFYERYGRTLSQGGALFLQTRPGVSPAAVAQRITGAAKTPVQVEFSSREPAPVRTAAHILTGGALSFVVVAALVGVLALALSSSRHHSSGVQSQQVERVLGLTTGERVLGHAAPSLISAAAGAVVCLAGALLAGWIEPLGSLRTSEPYPGYAANWPVALGGAVTVVLLVLLTSGVSAARAISSRTAIRSPRRALRLSRSPVFSAGLRMAFGSRGSWRSFSAITGVTVAVAGMLASASLWTSMRHLADTPSHWGVNADLYVADARPDLVEGLKVDPRVRGLTREVSDRVSVGGRDLSAYSVEHVLGDVGWTMVEGRAPQIDSELVLGPRAARALDTAVGDSVSVRTRAGTERFTVTGIGIGAFNGEAFGDNALFTPGGLQEVGRGANFYTLDVALKPGRSVDAFAAELSRDWEIALPSVPAEVTSLEALGDLPIWLGLFFVSIGLAALAHSSVQLVRRGVGDFAVLRTIGFTAGQLAGVLLTAVLITTTLGLAVGFPLGLGAGRLIWWSVTNGVGVVPDFQLPPVTTTFIVPAALLASVLLAAWPAIEAGRLRTVRAARTD